LEELHLKAWQEEAAVCLYNMMDEQTDGSDVKQKTTKYKTPKRRTNLSNNKKNK